MGLLDGWDDWWRELVGEDDNDILASDDGQPLSDEELAIEPITEGALIDATDDDAVEINPATRLPMVGGIGGFDVAGNLYGFSDDDILRSPFEDD